MSSIAAGDFHTLVCTGEPGCVYAFGKGESGRLGLGNERNSLSAAPVQFPGDEGLQGRGIVGVAAGSSHSLAVNAEGQVYSWGSNSHGQLAQAEARGARPINSVPVHAYLLKETTGDRWLNVRKVAAGGLMSAAIEADTDHLWLWGKSQWAVARGRDPKRSTKGGANPASPWPRPVRVPASAFSGLSVVDIALGTAHLVASCRPPGLAGSRRRWLFTWGENGCGQLGLGDFEPRGTPTLVEGLAGQDIPHVAAGGGHTAVVVRDPEEGAEKSGVSGWGGVWTWGQGNHGQLADGKKGNKNFPLKVGGLPSGMEVQVLSCGQYNTVCILGHGDDAGGGAREVWAWGMEEGRGLLGAASNKGTDNTPSRLHLPHGGAVDIAAGVGHTVALAGTAGTSLRVYAWGKGRGGTLGTGDEGDQWHPARAPLPAPSRRASRASSVSSPKGSGLASLPDGRRLSRELLSSPSAAAAAASELALLAGANPEVAALIAAIAGDQNMTEAQLSALEAALAGELLAADPLQLDGSPPPAAHRPQVGVASGAAGPAGGGGGGGGAGAPAAGGVLGRGGTAGLESGAPAVAADTPRGEGAAGAGRGAAEREGRPLTDRERAAQIGAEILAAAASAASGKAPSPLAGSGGGLGPAGKPPRPRSNGSSNAGSPALRPMIPHMKPDTPPASERQVPDFFGGQGPRGGAAEASGVTSPRDSGESPEGAAERVGSEALGAARAEGPGLAAAGAAPAAAGVGAEGGGGDGGGSLAISTVRALLLENKTLREELARANERLGAMSAGQAGGSVPATAGALAGATRQELERLKAFHRGQLSAVEEALFNRRLEEQVQMLLLRSGPGSTAGTPPPPPAWHHFLSPRDTPPAGGGSPSVVASPALSSPDPLGPGGTPGGRGGPKRPPRPPSAR